MKRLLSLTLAVCLMLTLALASGISWAQGPVPFVCTGEAYTVRDTPAQLYRIDQTVTPFLFIPVGGTATGPFGAGGAVIPIQLNNLGYRITDNLLYAVAMPTSGEANYGVVQIDSTGTVFPVSVVGLPTNVRFLAGDVTPDGSTMYINTYPSTSMYSVDLTSLTVSAPLLLNQSVSVADWAVNPVDGLLYGAAGAGASISGNAPIYSLDPGTGAIVKVGEPLGLPFGGSGDAAFYGGAWFNAAGRLFVYRNNDVIYEIDLSGPTVVGFQAGGAGSSQFNDAAACAARVPAIDIQKTVYAGHDSGASAPGGEFVENPASGLVTYVFTITNVGDVQLDITSFTDSHFDLSGAVLLSGALPLGPGEKIVFYLETTVQENLVNQACVEGTTIEGVVVSDCDTAAVLAPCECEPPAPEGEGCTPGYWKQDQHVDSWPATGYAPNDSFNTVFGVAGPDITLLEGLNLRGGGENAMIRHAVAALLNAASPDVFYAYSVAEVIAFVQAAYLSGDFEGIKMLLERQNESGCPLN